MNVTMTKYTIKNAPPRKSILIEGNHGMGKSQVVAQCAAELSQEQGKPYGFIDIRLSQREVGDLIGIPRSVATFEVSKYVYENGVKKQVTESVKNATVHDLPLFFPTDPESCGILFMDEIHYATKDVLQAVFELALDYRFNFTDLPKGWRVIAAGNDNQDVYGGTTINPALYDRFLKIKFKPTAVEFQDHAAKIGVHKAVTAYTSKFPTDLDPPESIEPGTIYPSRRSWVSLSDWIIHLEKQGQDPLKNLDYLTLLAKGYVGDTVGLNWIEYVKNSYKLYTGEDILNKPTEEIWKDIGAMVVTEVSFYSKEVVKFIKENKKLTKKQSENLLKYVQTIPKEAATGFWDHFGHEAREIAVKWYNDQPGAETYIFSLISKKESLK